MGVEFSALDGTRTRRAFDGSLRPLRVDLPREWEHFHLHTSSAAALFAVLEVTNRIGARCDIADTFADHSHGEISIPHARRAIMTARARFDSLAPAVVDSVDAALAWMGLAYENERVITGAPNAPEDVLRRLNDFAGYVEAAAAAGADRVAWS